MKFPHQKHFLVCTGERCNNLERGEERGEIIRAELKELNKQLGRKQIARICAVSCLDLCDHGPNMVVYPDGIVYSHLDRAAARRVYDAIMGDGPPADDKLLTTEEYEAAREAKAKSRG